MKLPAGSSVLAIEACDRQGSTSNLEKNYNTDVQNVTNSKRSLLPKRHPLQLSDCQLVRNSLSTKKYVGHAAGSKIGVEASNKQCIMEIKVSKPW